MLAPMKLDIGCGVWKKPGFIGLDLEPDPGLDVIGDAHHLPFREVFGKVRADQVFEHLRDPSKALRECSQVLKPRGILNISIPNIVNARRFFRWFLKEKTTVAQEHIFAWGLPELIHFANQEKFKFVEHYFETHSRYHELSFIEGLLKKVSKQSVEKNLVGVFEK